MEIRKCLETVGDIWKEGKIRKIKGNGENRKTSDFLYKKVCQNQTNMKAHRMLCFFCKRTVRDIH